MPNKMIYVSEADLPIFERAQALASSSLSAVIARALRLFVQTEEARTRQPQPPTTETASEGEFMRRSFRGRRLARQTVHTADDRLVNQIVTRNARGKLALYTTDIPRWSTYNQDDWTTWDWNAQDYRLETYDTLDALKPHISASLYEDVLLALREEAEADKRENEGKE